VTLNEDVRKFTLNRLYDKNIRLSKRILSTHQDRTTNQFENSFSDII
jgi:hypothetical protein